MFVFRSGCDLAEKGDPAEKGEFQAPPRQVHASPGHVEPKNAQQPTPRVPQVVLVDKLTRRYYWVFQTVLDSLFDAIRQLDYSR